jgi:epsilon-lactone hydrolase
MSLAMRIKRDHLPLPGGMILFCPGWTSPEARISAANDETAAAMYELVDSVTDQYLDGHPIDEPLLNPLSADLTGLPPMLIQAATADPLREDAHQLAQRARAHGVDAKLELFPIETHTFQTFWYFLREAKDALERAGAFVRTVARDKRAKGTALHI